MPTLTSSIREWLNKRERGGSTSTFFYYIASWPQTTYWNNEDPFYLSLASRPIFLIFAEVKNNCHICIEPFVANGSKNSVR